MAIGNIENPLKAIKNRIIRSVITAVLWMFGLAVLSGDPGASIVGACIIGYVNYVTNT